jgi:ATPase family associated with various cellular activities (AAA)
LPHVPSAEVFSDRWKLIAKQILGGPELPPINGVQLRIAWPSLSVEFLAEDVAPMLRSDLYHCHEFVRALAVLLELKKPNKRRAAASANLIDEANRLLRLLSAIPGEKDRKDVLENEFGPDQLPQTSASGFLSRLLPLFRLGRSREQIQQSIATAAAAVEYISDGVAKYYFGKAREYIAQHIVKTEIGQLHKEVRSERLQVIDLPSFADQKTRSLVLNSVLATIWESARADWAQAVATGKDERVPTFIVVDEAHNLIPAQVRSLGAEALREQFRAVAAEGRKYGLFLIVCTQRPDKIDPLVLSECENIAIMKLGSRSVLETAQRLLGLEEIPTATVTKCLEFETGRAIIIGRWSKGGPKILYSAMRRTVEGGTSLQDSYWARPIPPPATVPAASGKVADDKSAHRAKKKSTRRNQAAGDKGAPNPEVPKT